MKLLEMSVCAGVLALAVTLLRTAGLSRLPKRIFVLLWTVVLVRLLVPANLPIKSGIAVPAVRLLKEAACWIKMRLQAGSAGDAAALVPEAASSGAGGTGIWMEWFSEFSAVFYGIWIIGAAVTGCYFISAFFREYRLLEQALPLETAAGLQGASNLPDSERAHLRATCDSACRIAGIRPKSGKKNWLSVHDRLASPLVRGLFRQRIVLPRQMLSMRQTQMEYILVHEMVHVRRRDNFWKVLSAAAVCLHWFNPMAWVMYVLLDRDLELACDERVVALYGSRSREDYAMTILDFARNQKGTVVFSSGFGKNPTKERIVEVMRYKRLTSAGILCAALLLAGAGTVFAAEDSLQAPKEETAAKAEQAQNPSDTEAGADQTQEAGADQKEDAVIYEVNGEGDSDKITISFSDEIDADKYYVKESHYVTDENGETKAIRITAGEKNAENNGREYEMEIPTDTGSGKTEKAD